MVDLRVLVKEFPDEVFVARGEKDLFP